MIKVVVFLFLSLVSFQGIAAVDLMLEAGYVWQNRNDTRIPPDTGDTLDFDTFDKGPFFHYRVETVVKYFDNHWFRFVYAPFEIDVSGASEIDIRFKDSTFSSAQDIDVSYKFNSYRLGYIYKLSENFQIGFTGKIRDAKIQLSQNGLTETNTNVGFVPLLYFATQWELSKGFHFVFETDFAAASQGRAVDGAIKFRREFADSLQVGLGFRSLEGGADNETVVAFSWFNYAVLDLKFTF